MYIHVRFKALPTGYMVSHGAIQAYHVAQEFEHAGDLINACDKYEDAAILMHPAADYALFRCLMALSTRTEDADLDGARLLRHLLVASHNGIAEAMMDLAGLYESGLFSPDLKPDKKEAYKWYCKAADCGISAATGKLFELGSQHPEVVPSPEKTQAACTALSP